MPYDGLDPVLSMVNKEGFLIFLLIVLIRLQTPVSHSSLRLVNTFTTGSSSLRCLRDTGCTWLRKLRHLRAGDYLPVHTLAIHRRTAGRSLD